MAAVRREPVVRQAEAVRMGPARLVAPVRTVAVRLVGRGGSAVRTCTFIRSISFASALTPDDRRTVPWLSSAGRRATSAKGSRVRIWISPRVGPALRQRSHQSGTGTVSIAVTRTTAAWPTGMRVIRRAWRRLARVDSVRNRLWHWLRRSDREVWSLVQPMGVHMVRRNMADRRGHGNAR